MAEYTTWITEKNEKVDRVRLVHGDTSPGPEWRQVPNDWGGSHGDSLAWFGNDNKRIPDQKLVEEGKRKDNRGRWHNKHQVGETKLIYGYDEEPGEDWTKEEPLKDEPYQKWDPKKKKFVADIESKKKAEKENKISEKKNAIQIAEQKKLRSLIAKLEGVATEKDEEKYNQFSSEIISLREEINELER